MAKLNRQHGIGVGSKVKVLNAEGSSAYIPYIGKILTVSSIETSSDWDCDLITCEPFEKEGFAQHPSRFELISEQQPNGVDQNGKPIYFDASMLEIFMRAVDRSGCQYIVVPNGNGDGFLFVDANGQHCTSMSNHASYNQYDMVEVFAAPAPAPRC